MICENCHDEVERIYPLTGYSDIWDLCEKCHSGLSDVINGLVRRKEAYYRVETLTGYNQTPQGPRNPQENGTPEGPVVFG